jgi:hypothetical protein
MAALRRTSLGMMAGHSARVIIRGMIRRGILVCACCALFVSSAAARTDPWKALHRPLHIPHVATGSPCPVAARDPKGDLSRLGSFVGTAWGLGPAYPAGLSDARPTLSYQWPPSGGFAGSEWSGQKVLWIVGRYRGSGLLVRGRQVDGANGVGFNLGITPAKELRLVGRGGHPTYTRVRAPGCYAFQIDGATFSRIIVFEALPLPPPQTP